MRTYFDRQGFFALRGISFRYDDEEVTDIDVWLYGRQSASVRTRAVVDVKNKRSPKAFERIMWVRGIQLALGCDRAIVATTDRNTKIASFANQQNVSLLTKDFLSRLQNRLDTGARLTLEQFTENIHSYAEQKHDGDWWRQIVEAKSAILSLQGYPAFNRSVAAFRFFAERLETRPHQREQALRCAYFTAALSCIALDVALERIVYDDRRSRYKSILQGVKYGDTGDERVQRSVKTVLQVISDGMDGGRAIARQADVALNSMFDSVRADIIAEYFSIEANAAKLVDVAIELDHHAHRISASEIQTVSVDAKSIIGVLADHVSARRFALLSDGAPGRTDDRGDSVEEGRGIGEAREGGRVKIGQADMFLSSSESDEPVHS